MNDQERERLQRDLSDALEALRKNESFSGLDSLADRLISLGKTYAFDASLIRSAVSRKDTGAIRIQLIQVLDKLERGKH